MKAEILALLRERGDYVSGQELCGRFGVSRTAVWKAVEQLKKEGYPIEAVRNRGYLLLREKSTTEQEIFGASEIESRLHTKWAGHPVRFYTSTDSTNTRVKAEAENGAPHGLLVVADQQTAGKGRRGRAWESPAGINIYFTILLRPELEPDRTPMLTLVMALAVAEGIRKTYEAAGLANLPSVGIKWPNDIVIGGKKVCGILTEMSLSVEQADVQYVVIGVGINVRRQTFPEELAAKAVSLDEAGNCRVNRSVLAAYIMDAFERDYEIFVENGDLSGLQDIYNAMLVNRDTEVCVLDPKGEYCGIARGINTTGELLVEREDGSVTNVYAGEVSVRGIYGYI